MSFDFLLQRELAVKHNTESVINSFLVSNIFPATCYSLTISCVCIFETLKTVSVEESLQFSTRPDPPVNLSLEGKSPNSLTVKWDPSPSQLTSHRYKLSIECPVISYSAEYNIGADRTTFNFSKLPDIIGTGETYEVKVEYIVTPVGDDEEVR